MIRKIAINIEINRKVIPPRVKTINFLPESFTVKDKKTTNTRKFKNASPIPADKDTPELIEIKLNNRQTIIMQNSINETKTGYLILFIKFLFFIYL